jgi:prepilin-type N-terminal cleavage/methylation domain-containing protein
MKNNQKGFSAVEVLIVILIVGLIGAVGWFVYDRQNTDKTATNNVGQSDDSDKNAEYSQELKQGYKLYENDDLYLQYPDTWEQYELADQVGTVYFKSPDFKAPTAEGPGPTALAGYMLELITLDELLPEDNFENYVKNLGGPERGIGGDFSEIKIDGNDAVLSDIKTHGTYIEGITFKNEKQFIFRLNAVDEDKPEVKELITTLLGSVQFK